jgi:hypothetical protein
VSVNVPAFTLTATNASGRVTANSLFDNPKRGSSDADM